VFLRSFKEFNDNCTGQGGLEHATRLKSSGDVDVLVALPCSLCEFSSVFILYVHYRSYRNGAEKYYITYTQ